ncbi:hypothetical protein B0A53_04769 [Rhodotorula sp. CCFEE 5036]|nr:hypothetical protein B0A53_04769 [Rhodotorula sp. CCFEE 5036]
MSLTAAAAAAIGAPPSAPQLEAASSLPFPVSFHSRPAYHKHDTSPSRAFVGTTTTAATRGAAAALGFIGHNIASRPLTARSRATRLAVWLLGATLAVSVLLNIRFLVWDGHRGFRERVHAYTVPQSVLSTIPAQASPLRHLVIVPGHAVWSGSDASLASRDRDWILEPMQKGGSVRTYLKHIVKGVEIAVRDPHALLIFSGGQTRTHADATEGMSYARLAKLGNLYTQFMSDEERRRRAKNPDDEFERVTTEDFALDSMENVLFSIARFKEFTGHYPDRITVVGYGMKRARYEDVHRAAIRWPMDKFEYIGIDNEGDTTADYEGERKYGLEPYRLDRYGCHGRLLAKRRKRNPFRRFHGYHSSAPELKDLFEYCPLDNKLFAGPLPWDH